MNHIPFYWYMIIYNLYHHVVLFCSLIVTLEVLGAAFTKARSRGKKKTDLTFSLQRDLVYSLPLTKAYLSAACL